MSEQTPLTADWGGPYVLAATFCERVLIEQNGLSSIIRLVQRINIAGSGTVQVRIALVIQLAAGKATGKQTLTIVQQLPSGLTGGSRPLTCSLKRMNASPPSF
ncbi:MAG: hypothetical protein M1396_00610 [Chloroflexi bacterium]|nr:hypothetical protein [Chloroflexota bacterium]